MQKRWFEVGGLWFSVGTTDGSEWPIEMPDAYLPFERKEKKADGQQIFELYIDQKFSLPAKGKWIGQFNEENTPQTVYLLENGDYQFELQDEQHALTAEMQAEAGFGRARVALHGTEAQMIMGLNNCIMIAYAFSSAMHKTLLMHASVIGLHRHGYLFLGKSGTGKSTHSQLWLKNFPQTELVNDDNPVVGIRNGKTIVYGSPWSGKTPCYKDLQCWAQAFVWLEQKPYNRIERQSKVEAFASLLMSTSLMTWDKPIYRALGDTITEILGQTAVYHLQCLPDEEAAQLCRTVIER